MVRLLLVWQAELVVVAQLELVPALELVAAPRQFVCRPKLRELR